MFLLSFKLYSIALLGASVSTQNGEATIKSLSSASGLKLLLLTNQTSGPTNVVLNLNRSNHSSSTTFKYNTDFPRTGNSGYERDRLSDIDQVIFRTRNLTHGNWLASGQATTLRQVLLLHRHGDRTPIDYAPRDEVASEPFWQFHGLGQLTNRGKARLFMLGKIIRDRYNVFLRGSTNKSLRTTRASGSLRCIESAQVFLASFLALDLENSPDRQRLVWDTSSLSQVWQPASVSAMSARYDGMLNEGAVCNRFNELYSDLDSTSQRRQLDEEFKDVATIMQDEIGFEIDHFYKWFWASALIAAERSYFAEKINPRILSVYDRLQVAGDRALGMQQSTDDIRRLKAGLLINDILSNMETVRDSYSTDNKVDMTTKKFIHYTGHDLHNVLLLGMLDNWHRYPVQPDYASTLLFELHQDTQSTNQWFIRFYYMPHIPMVPIELHFDECLRNDPDNRCKLDRFHQLMQKYRIPDWQTWMRECKNNISQVDPYLPNN